MLRAEGLGLWPGVGVVRAWGCAQKLGAWQGVGAWPGSLGLRPAVGRMWPAYFWTVLWNLPTVYRALMQVLGPRLWIVLVIGLGAIPLPPQPLTTFLHVAQLPHSLLNSEQLPS